MSTVPTVAQPDRFKALVDLAVSVATTDPNYAAPEVLAAHHAMARAIVDNPEPIVEPEARTYLRANDDAIGALVSVRSEVQQARELASLLAALDRSQHERFNAAVEAIDRATARLRELRKAHIAISSDDDMPF